MLRLAVFAVLLSSCATVTPLETTFVPNPNSGLKVAYSADNPGVGTIVEYVPPGETIEDWRHLVTIQFLENERRSLDELVAKLEETMRQFGGTLEWTVLERDANSVLYEWRLLDRPKEGALYQDECEVSRFLRGNDGVHRVAYTERARTMDPAKRSHYIEVFRKAYVVKGNDLQPVEVKP